MLASERLDSQSAQPRPHSNSFTGRMKSFLFKTPQLICVGVAWPGKRLQFDVHSDRKILHIKQLIAEKANIPVEVQLLTFQGKILKDHKSLRDYKIKNDRTILLTRLGINLSQPQIVAARRKNNGDGEVVPNPSDALSLPAESNRYSAHEAGNRLAASSRPPDADGGPQAVVEHINKFLDEWLGGKGTPRMLSAPGPQPTPHAQADGVVDAVVLTLDGDAQQSQEAVHPNPESHQQQQEQQHEQQQQQQQQPEQQQAQAQQAQAQAQLTQPEAPARPAKRSIPANYPQMDLMRSLMEDPPTQPVQMTAAPQFLEKEEDDGLIKFVVRFGKKDIKLKMKSNEDLWALKLKLEANKVGKAGQLILTNEDGDELDEDGTLEENDISNATKLVVRLKD